MSASVPVFVFVRLHFLVRAKVFMFYFMLCVIGRMSLCVWVCVFMRVPEHACVRMQLLEFVSCVSVHMSWFLLVDLCARARIGTCTY